MAHTETGANPVDNDGECKHGMLAGTCTICVPKPSHFTPPPSTQFSGGKISMKARYEGRCPECNDWIELYDLIWMREGHWVCDECHSHA